MSVNLHPLARRYGFTAPTVRKWRERDSTPDSAHAPSGLRLLRASRQTLHRLFAGTIGVSPEIAVRYRPPGLTSDLPELHDQAARPANSYDPKSLRPSRSQGSGALCPSIPVA